MKRPLTEKEREARRLAYERRLAREDAAIRAQVARDAAKAAERTPEEKRAAVDEALRIFGRQKGAS